jgi:hypothetical protein
MTCPLWLHRLSNAVVIGLAVPALMIWVTK